jgi:iron(III) transport system substrate-binding protein
MRDPVQEWGVAGGGRGWFTRAFAVLGTLLVTACAPTSDNVLVVYSPHGRDHLSYFAEAFEARHPGLDVQFVDMGSQEILDRLRSEQANPQADVWWGAPAEIFAQGAAAGYLEPFRPTWADALDDEAQDPDNLWFATYLTPEVIAYNEAAISREEAPKDWDDVLDPRWRGEVIIREPLASGTMRAIFGSIIQREIERTGDPNAGYEWLLRLDAQTREYVLNPTLLYQKLARQEGLITLWTMPDIEILRATTDFPINYILPASGTPIVIDGVGVVAGSRNPEMARAFVEFVGDTEALVEASERFFRIPARNDIAPEQLPEWLRTAMPLIIPMEVDGAAIRARTSEWMRYWDDQIRRRGAAEGY